MKKTVGFIVSVVMIFSLVSTSFAAEYYEYGNNQKQKVYENPVTENFIVSIPLEQVDTFFSDNGQVIENNLESAINGEVTSVTNPLLNGPIMSRALIETARDTYYGSFDWGTMVIEFSLVYDSVTKNIQTVFVYNSYYTRNSHVTSIEVLRDIGWGVDGKNITFRLTTTYTTIYNSMPVTAVGNSPYYSAPK